MKPLKIGTLAKQTGTNTPTIRYYEEIGLLPSAGRQAGNQRIYGDEDVRSLTFIRRCREFGFSIDQVRSLVALVQDPTSSCTNARDLAHQHLIAIQAKLADLKALERSVAAFVTNCDASCAGGPGPDCVIVDDLSKCRDDVPSRKASGCQQQGPSIRRNCR